MACTRGPIVDQRYLHDLKGARRELASIIQRKNAAPLLLRLAFHDAANYNAMNNTGGVNGSIRIRQELNQSPNNGIHDGVKICEEVKKKHPLVTYADIIQLAGILSVELSGGPAINFVPGPADTNVADQLNIPNPRGGADHLRRTFYQMGLSDKDIVALSGAHTLGRARRENSGFDGPFTRNTLKFDNSYYVELMRGETPGLVKFPTDKALMQDPVFRQFVELYARNEGAFFRDYAESHKKMSELGFVPQNMFGDGCGIQAETDCCETQNYNNYNYYDNNSNYNNNYDCCPGMYQNRGSACY